jgi:hypothetical protein
LEDQPLSAKADLLAKDEGASLEAFGWFIFLKSAPSISLAQVLHKPCRLNLVVKP